MRRIREEQWARARNCLGDWLANMRARRHETVISQNMTHCIGVFLEASSAEPFRWAVLVYDVPELRGKIWGFDRMLQFEGDARSWMRFLGVWNC